LSRPASEPDSLARFQDLVAQAEAVGADLEVDQIPDALGALERVRERLRFRAFAAVQPSDRLVEIPEAAELLSMSEDTLYKKAATFPFTVRQGRSLRFSFLGIQKYIRANQGRG
jgi:predicted DNA-binding transcriptional regulator AlpA